MDNNVLTSFLQKNIKTLLFVILGAVLVFVLFRYISDYSKRSKAAGSYTVTANPKTGTRFFNQQFDITYTITAGGDINGIDLRFTTENNLNIINISEPGGNLDQVIKNITPTSARIAYVASNAQAQLYPSSTFKVTVKGTANGDGKLILNTASMVTGLQGAYAAQNIDNPQFTFSGEAGPAVNVHIDPVTKNVNKNENTTIQFRIDGLPTGKGVAAFESNIRYNNQNLEGVSVALDPAIASLFTETRKTIDPATGLIRFMYTIKTSTPETQYPSLINVNMVFKGLAAGTSPVTIESPAVSGNIPQISYSINVTNGQLVVSDVTTARPDLTVVDLHLVQPAQANQELTVTGTLRNIGTAATGNNFPYRILLDTTEIYAGVHTIIAAGGEHVFSNMAGVCASDQTCHDKWKSPASGTHVFRVETTVTNDSNPNNNNAQFSFTVGQPLTPSPTITPTPTTGATATETPIPIPTGGSANVQLNLKLKFQGIIDRQPPSALNTMRVKVTARNSSSQVDASGYGDFVANNGGLWTGQVSLNIPAGGGYRILIKGPKHIQKKICEAQPQETAPGTYPGENGCLTDAITLQNGVNTFGFAGIYQLVGDLPDQDGFVNSYDTSLVYNNLGKTDAEAIRLADVNLDGAVNTQDFSLIIAALSVRSDEQ